MSEIITVGLDLGKNVFQVHGADGSGRAVLRKKLRRDQVLSFFGRLPHCVVAMEACGGAHFWSREIGKLGHEVKCHDAIVGRRAHAVIPPHKNARPWKTETAGAGARNEPLRASKYLGRALWRRRSGYHRQSRAEI